MVATSSSTPSRMRVMKVRAKTPAGVRPLEPAALGPDADGVGRLRHPPSGPHVSAPCRVLPPVSDEARRLSDGGASPFLRHRGLREQVPLFHARCPDRKSTRLNSSHANIS